MIRVRQITDHLSYADLLRQGLIPDVVQCFQQDKVVAVKRYSPFVYQSKDFPGFGIFMDYLVRAVLRTHLAQPFDLGVDPVSERIASWPEEQALAVAGLLSGYETSTNINDLARISRELAALFCGRESFSVADIQKYVPTMVNIGKELATRWQAYAACLAGTIRYNVELSVEDRLSGHPDIVTDQTILDIKNTTSFSKMRESSILQVLAYAALSKNHRYIGFVLPMQREIAICDLTGWDSSKYLQLLQQRTSELTSPVTIEQALKAALRQVNRASWGSHIHKGKDLAVSLSTWSHNRPGLPCQVFITNPRSGKRAASTEASIPRVRAAVDESGLTFYTHAPYVINLCANQCDNKDGVLVYWQQEILNEDLRITAAMGGKGVVVHTGAATRCDSQTGRNIMYSMVHTALQFATPECKLLLETPCGEGTEICTRIEELGEFFHLFTAEEREKMGLCVDTCHVFAAGYDPLQYLQHWKQYVQAPICLVHFNDSKQPKGSKVDKHAPPGKGHICMERMLDVSAWCQEHNIPMVTE